MQATTNSCHPPAAGNSEQPLVPPTAGINQQPLVPPTAAGNNQQLTTAGTIQEYITLC